MQRNELGRGRFRAWYALRRAVARAVAGKRSGRETAENASESSGRKGQEQGQPGKSPQARVTRTSRHAISRAVADECPVSSTPPTQAPRRDVRDPTHRTNPHAPDTIEPRSRPPSGSGPHTTKVDHRARGSAAKTTLRCDLRARSVRDSADFSRPQATTAHPAHQLNQATLQPLVATNDSTAERFTREGSLVRSQPRPLQNPCIAACSSSPEFRSLRLLIGRAKSVRRGASAQAKVTRTDPITPLLPRQIRGGLAALCPLTK
jgi:hypothetical protein